MNSHDNPSGQRNYWESLSQAFSRLAEDDFAAAEMGFFAAEQQRESSPGRVFLTEKLGDRLQRMLHRKDPEVAASDHSGRWAQRSGDFRAQFEVRADEVVREGLRLAGLRPEDEAHSNQPVLERALFLVSGSRLFPQEPRSAIPLLKGLFRTAQKTGLSFSPQLVRHDLPLTEEDRLWLAAKGGDMLEAFMEHENLAPGSVEAGEWARAILQILRQEYFGSSSRLEAERSWLEAVSADRLLAQPGSCVALYRQYLVHAPGPGPRADEARLRMLEILANVDDLHLLVPRYEEAVAALPRELELSDRLGSARRKIAMDCIAFRMPGVFTEEAAAWASVGLEADGSLGIVFWWDDQPRDMAFWCPGTDASDLDRLLERCGERVVAWSGDVVRCVGEQWEHPCNKHSALGLAAALLEPVLPVGGLVPEDLLQIALAEIGPWRGDWTSRLGHPGLKPPVVRESLESWHNRPGNQGLLAGLLVLAMRSRLESSDPSLRAGIRELGRRGDEASWFLYELVSLGKPAILALDETFAPWTLPLLWTRPGPWDQRRGSSEPLEHEELQPDLGRNALSIVTTGSPQAVLRAWGDDQTKWRVVWDCFERAVDVITMSATVLGPVTLIPAEGRIHALGPALELLDQELAASSTGDPDTVGLMGIFHWIRLVETHNGNLEDFYETRRRSESNIEIYDRYHEFISELPYISDAGHDHDPWSEQYQQRVRKSGLVAGAWSLLDLNAKVLDDRWGVFDGSDASWVFLDSAAVHRGLLRSGEGFTRNLHTLLSSRGHRHLSLLTGSSWMADVLGSYLAYLLQAFGRPYHLTLQDRHPPLLKLVDQGIRPDAHQLRDRALSSQLLWLKDYPQPQELEVFVHDKGLNGHFWQDVAGKLIPGLELEAEFLDLENTLPSLRPDHQGKVLVLPVLPGYEPGPNLVDQDPSSLDWASMDDQHNDRLDHNLARCALELAGLMAGSWREIVVLDTRWWHLLWGRDREVESEHRTWSFAVAQQMAGAGNAQPLQLPTADPTGGPPAGMQMVVGRWLHEHAHEAVGREPERSLGGKDAVILELGGDRRGWQPYAERIEIAREQGQLGAWMLMVAAECDDSWRDIIERDGAHGCSVLRDERFPLRPSALVWMTPEEIREPLVLREIFRHPPTVIHILEMESWLPAAGNERHFEALALREILQAPGARVVLHAQELAKPWVDFLTGLLGERLQVLHPGDAGDSGESPGSEGHATATGYGLGVARSHVHLRNLLAGLRSRLVTARGADPGPNGLVSAHELISLKTLARLTGLREQDVALGIRALRWALGVGGEHLPAAVVDASRQAPLVGLSAGGQSHAVLIANRFAELEHTLQQMERDLRVLVPLWLQGLAPGMRTWVDLECPPADVDGLDLMRLDALLNNWCGPEGGPGGMVYDCPAGTLNSNRRWLGCDGNAGSLTGDLVERLVRLRLRVGEMMDAAVETPGGFLVDTGLRNPGPGEMAFLSRGSELGFWRWLGPVSEESLSMVDLLALADVADRPGAELAWQLCAQLLEDPVASSLTSPASAVAQSPSRPGYRGPMRGLRNLLSGESRAEDEFQAGISLIATGALACKPGQIVLRGPAGSGRHETLVRGIVKACETLSLPPDVKVFCPDAAVAAHVSEQFMRWGPGLAWHVEIPANGLLMSGQVHPVPPANTGQIVVLCEAQRLPADMRYKISQLGRGRLLIITVDPWASEESWENLFLTAPRPEQVWECQHQRKLSRRIWAEVRDLFPSDKPLPGGALVPERGELSAVYASNLDQCLGRLFADTAFSGPQAFLRVVAGVRGDLDYLASSLADRGWDIVDEKKLEPWLTPGPREFLAVLMDLEAKGVNALVPRLLVGVSGEWWSRWCALHQDLLEQDDLGAAWSRLRCEDFLQGTLAHAAHRGRVEKLLKQEDPIAPGEFLAGPLVATAQRFLHRGLQLAPPEQLRPTALLAEAGDQPGLMAPAGMYLCLGSEHPRRHYQHWSRIVGGLLVLYQERSPLPGARRH